MRPIRRRPKTEAVPPRPVEWTAPMPLGYFASIQNMGGLAAPLLAGASFTMIALLLPVANRSDQRFARWPDVSLMLLVVAALSMITSVQASVWSRRYETRPSELTEWFPAEVDDGRPSSWLRLVQRDHHLLATRWAGRARVIYNVGILALLAAVTVACVPPGAISASRWVLVWVAAAGVFGELGWLTATISHRGRIPLGAAGSLLVDTGLGILLVAATHDLPVVPGIVAAVACAAGIVVVAVSARARGET